MSEENIGGEEGIIDERRKKLENLRNNMNLKQYLLIVLKSLNPLGLH